MARADGLDPDPAALYLGHVIAERLRTRVLRSGLVLDMGDPELPVRRHLEAAGLRTATLPESGSEGVPFDGAWIAAERWPAGRDLASLLRPGAFALVRVSRRSGPTLSEVRASLGSRLSWRRSLVLGLCVPSRDRADWVFRHPQSFGLLAAVEGLVCEWPFLRTSGRALVLEGVRP